jgi:hypothetical protein
LLVVHCTVFETELGWSWDVERAYAFINFTVLAIPQMLHLWLKDTGDKKSMIFEYLFS